MCLGKRRWQSCTNRGKGLGGLLMPFVTDASLPERSKTSHGSMLDLFGGLGAAYAVSRRVLRGRPQAMNAYNTADWYRMAQERMTAVALAVQRQDQLDLEALSALA